MRFAACLAFAGSLLAQAPAKIPPDLRFDVASIKPTEEPGLTGGIRPAPGGERYQARNCPIKLMIQVAYRLRDDQVVGGPGWLDTDRWDMEAKAAKPSTSDELHVMLKNLLADRLNLKFHHEPRELSRYALTVDKGGPKLEAHKSADAGEIWIDQKEAPFLHMTLTGTSVPMDYLAFRLSQVLDRPVVNQTNLPGEFDFKLAYTRDLPPGTPEGMRINGEAPDTSGPTIFQAIKQQLGLELKPGKGPVDVIVIDHADRPSAN